MSYNKVVDLKIIKCNLTGLRKSAIYFELKKQSLAIFYRRN